MPRLARLLPAALVLLSVGCGRSPFELELAVELELDGSDPVVGGCRKVDYLFVIDNSASMADNQLELVESFGVFIDGVEDTQRGLDSVHLGVVTTDSYAASPDSCHALGHQATTRATSSVVPTPRATTT